MAWLHMHVLICTSVYRGCVVGCNCVAIVDGDMQHIAFFSQGMGTTLYPHDMYIHSLTATIMAHS